jgi:cell division protein FtsI/penicillin-binding protein 2
VLGRTDSRGRLLVLLVAFVVASMAIVGRLAWWQIIQRDQLAAEAVRQGSVTIEEPARRGTVYDRSGVVALATTITRDRLAVAADRMTVTERRAVAAELSAILEHDEEAADDLRDRLATGKPYVVVARDLPPETSTAIRSALVKKELPRSVTLEPVAMRTYPQPGGAPGTTLAAHLLGFANREGVGQYGVEQHYQDLLAGRPRVLLAQRDVNSRPIPDTGVETQRGVPGADLHLTIDAGLQLKVEEEVLAAALADQARIVSAVVMDPYTGEILAYANYPSYDSNDFRRIATEDPSQFVDPIVSEVYEPGSVFKMFTATAALERGTVTPLSTIKDVGTLQLDGGAAKIDNADRKGMGWMTFQDAIAWSRNVVASKVALALGKDTRESSSVLHEVWRRLGFGAPTGIDVAGELPGLVRDPTIGGWQQIDLANASFGQGVAVTPIQLATGYAALMNGGKLVQPHVVKAIGEEEIGAVPRANVIDAKLSKTLVGMMSNVVTAVPFYRDRTLVPGYYVGGKTGTAQIWDARHKRWKSNAFNNSFVGYIGRQPGVPELLVAVRINEAKLTRQEVGVHEMPVLSFELFRRVATAAIKQPGLVPPTPPAAPVAQAADPSAPPVAADR